MSSSFVVAMDSSLTPPEFSGLASATTLGTNSIYLAWDSAVDDETPSEAITYNVYLATQEGEQNYDLPYESIVGSVEMTLAGLDSRTNYFIVVRAQDEDGSEESNTIGQQALTLTSYSVNVQPTLNNRCFSCHSSFGNNYGVDVSNYNNLMNSNIVVPFDASSSELSTKGNHHSSGWYNSTEQSTIDTWINEGALEN